MTLAGGNITQDVAAVLSGEYAVQFPGGLRAKEPACLQPKADKAMAPAAAGGSWQQGAWDKAGDHSCRSRSRSAARAVAKRPWGESAPPVMGQVLEAETPVGNSADEGGPTDAPGQPAAVDIPGIEAMVPSSQESGASASPSARPPTEEALAKATQAQVLRALTDASKKVECVRWAHQFAELGEVRYESGGTTTHLGAGGAGGSVTFVVSVIALRNRDGARRVMP